MYLSCESVHDIQKIAYTFQFTWNIMRFVYHKPIEFQVFFNISNISDGVCIYNLRLYLKYERL